MNQCTKCGGLRIENGSLITGVSGFPSILEDFKGVLYRSPGGKQIKVTHVYASTCLDCGHLELYLNPNELKEGIKKK